MKKWRVIEITKIIGILILTLCFQDSYCQPRQEVIKLSIVNKKRSYHTSDTINFNFLNVSGTKLWFIAGFEVLDEGKWKEIIYDLDGPLSKIEKIYFINKQKNLRFLVNNVPFTGPKSPAYKLFIKYGLNPKLLNSKKEELLQFVFLK